MLFRFKRIKFYLFYFTQLFGDLPSVRLLCSMPFARGVGEAYSILLPKLPFSTILVGVLRSICGWAENMACSLGWWYLYASSKVWAEGEPKYLKGSKSCLSASSCCLATALANQLWLLVRSILTSLAVSSVNLMQSKDLALATWPVLLSRRIVYKIVFENYISLKVQNQFALISPLIRFQNNHRAQGTGRRCRKALLQETA